VVLLYEHVYSTGEIPSWSEVPVLLFFHLFKLTLCNEQKQLSAIKLVFLILLFNNHDWCSTDIFYSQSFLQSRLSLLAQLSITTVRIGPVLLRAPLVALIKTHLSVLSSVLSNTLKPKKPLKSIE